MNTFLMIALAVGLIAATVICGATFIMQMVLVVGGGWRRVNRRTFWTAVALFAVSFVSWLGLLAWGIAVAESQPFDALLAMGLFLWGVLGIVLVVILLGSAGEAVKKLASAERPVSFADVVDLATRRK